MMIEHKTHSFKGTGNGEFFLVLKQRVNAYFEQTQLTRKGNYSLVLKGLVVFSLFLVPYFMIVMGTVNHSLVILGMWILMGLGKAGIGMCVMHDANHNSYSSNQDINNKLSLTMNLIGGNHEIWKIQHNVLHHTYTNIYGSDDDLSAPGILRLCPDAPRKNIHKYQYLYAFPLYCLSTITRIIFREFIQIGRFRKLGLLRKGRNMQSFMIQLMSWKLLYFGYILIIPLLFSTAPVWITIIGFFAMQFTTGFLLSLIFQTAHIVPEVDYPMPTDKGIIEEQWAVHEMLTTTNYAPKSRIFTWLIGGLNYQIEHHLFPNISHVHYKKLAPIVAMTAREYGIPYNVQGNFVQASINHMRMLYRLGRE